MLSELVYVGAEGLTSAKSNSSTLERKESIDVTHKPWFNRESVLLIRIIYFSLLFSPCYRIGRETGLEGQQPEG